MQNKSRKLNGVSAQRTLAKEIEASSKKLEQQRWLKTPEGEAYLTNKMQETRIAEMLVDLKVGQRVWQDVIAFKDDLFTIGDPGSLCCQISNIVDQGWIDAEMLFISINGIKFDEFSDHRNGMSKKGDVYNIPILDLEKHIAKNGNIWWKVKIY